MGTAGGIHKDPITPQEVQKGFWESLVSAADQVVDDFAYEMDCVKNDIKDAVDEGIQMVKDGAHWVQDALSDYHFTISIGGDFSGTPGIWQFDGAGCLSVDSKGNICIQVTKSGGSNSR